MTIAVTGSSGFFAQYVIRELLAHDYDVRGIDIKPPKPNQQALTEFIQADVTNLDQVKSALRGAIAVIHLAGIPHPLSDPADKVFSMNAVGSYVTAWAAGECGIERFVYASSESVLGTAFHPELFTPEYFPIDERHPTLPLDPYGISKVVSELAIERTTERFGYSTIALRMPWIWGMDNPELHSLYEELCNEYLNWKKNFWAYIDARDAARAFRLALRVPPEKGSFKPYYIVADHNWVAPQRTSLSLIEEFFPGVHVLNEPDSYFSLISNAKAKTELGWQPEFSNEVTGVAG